MVHRGGVKIKDFLEDMTPLFNEIVIFKSEKFRFKKPKKKKDLEPCKSCKFFRMDVYFIVIYMYMINLIIGIVEY